MIEGPWAILLAVLTLVALGLGIGFWSVIGMRLEMAVNSLGLQVNFLAAFSVLGPLVLIGIIAVVLAQDGHWPISLALVAGALIAIYLLLRFGRRRIERSHEDE